jgi:molybdopterin-guanine dinucleotide biosynthesis protein A
MPGLVPAVLEAMVETLHDPRVEAVLLDHDGRPRPLPMVLRRRPAEATAAQLIAAGERRLGALPEGLRSHVLDGTVWRALDPDARTMRDIDTPDDLD